MFKICLNCKEIIRDIAKFCDQCGMNVKEAERITKPSWNIYATQATPAEPENISYLPMSKVGIETKLELIHELRNEYTHRVPNPMKLWAGRSNLRDGILNWYPVEWNSFDEVYLINFDQDHGPQGHIPLYTPDDD